ncbi:MAG: S41 family peptidase [Planctomycetota bacterium]|jgi:C-terminal processing protease CtpA/Prc
MRSAALLLLALLPSTSALAGPAGLANPGFEEGARGKAPPGWFVPAPCLKAGYAARIVPEDPREGKACAWIGYEGEGAPQGFGNLMQAFDATPFRGKLFRLKAAIRVTGAASRAQMWIRVDRAPRKMGFFENMHDRPVRSSAWEEYEITGAIDPDAQYVNVGLMLFGTGEAYWDAVTFEITGDAPPPYEPEPARPLTERGLANLVAFARLYGYVRHFHPGDEAAKADWARIAVAGVIAVEDAERPGDLAGALESVFVPVAPGVRVAPKGEKLEPLAISPPEGEGPFFVRAWRHRGFGQERSMYRSTRMKEPLVDGKVPEGLPDPAKPLRADLGSVSCLVPLAAYADRDGTSPVIEGLSISDLENHVPSGDDRATRLADVVIAWNVFQHFYPYFDVVETDWPAALRRALTEAAEAVDERAFLDVLRRLVKELHDGHGGVYHQSEQRAFRMPFVWDWVEGGLVVTLVPDGDDSGLAAGDVVHAIDSVPAKDALAVEEALISGATPQWIRYRGVENLAWSETRGPRKLTVERAGKPGVKVVVEVEPELPRKGLAEPRPEKVAEVEPGVFYVDLSRVNDADFDAALPKLSKATGIVFDMRGYPRRIGPQTFFPHLVTEPSTSAQWHIPVLTRPDRVGITFERGREWQLFPQKPYLDAKRAFITDGRAISYAESCMGIVEHYRLGEIVGAATAGTNGNVNPVTLPGGYRVTWTGMKVLKHDGSRHHGVGILPTIPVSRTRAGVAAGRDELLERALEAVRPR